MWILFVVVVCVIVYFKFGGTKKAIFEAVVLSIIGLVISSFLIPSEDLISISDLLGYFKDNFVEMIDGKDNAEKVYDAEEEIFQDETEMEMINDMYEILPINTVSKNINDIKEKSLKISPVELNYYDGNITMDEQVDTYQFIPAINGRYRFEVMDMISGVKVRVVVLNQAGEVVADTFGGVENGQGLTVDAMIANEIYTVQVKQSSSYSPYRILLGSQKSDINIESGVTKVTDSTQYTDQKNIYKFTPLVNGRYRFELNEMISGSKVKLEIYNQGGERVADSSYGIANHEGVTVENMNAGETYDIVVIQDTSSTSYSLLIGHQKETAEINGETVISDSVQYTEQCNQYSFIPPVSGRYRFEITDMVSGVQVHINVLNQAGGMVENASYVSKGGGVTIDNMIVGEVYTIQIIQENSYGSYELGIGYQKESVTLTTNKISDTMQYVEQRNVYLFVPQSDDGYSFIISNMVSGMKVNIEIYNEGGECVDEISYGVENEHGLDIEKMVRGETYTIYVTQYDGEGAYSLTINRLKQE